LLLGHSLETGRTGDGTPVAGGHRAGAGASAPARRLSQEQPNDRIPQEPANGRSDAKGSSADLGLPPDPEPELPARSPLNGEAASAEREPRGGPEPGKETDAGERWLAAPLVMALFASGVF